MPLPPFRPLRPGQRRPASQENRETLEISNLSRPGVTGGIDLTHGGGPPLIEDNRPQGIVIKIGAGSGNAYAWTRQVLSPAGTMADGMDYGTTTSVPAYEINGVTTVASGTIVRAWPSPAGDGLIFQVGGSGSGGDLDWRAYVGRDACPAAGQYLLSGSSQGYQTGNLATLSTSGDWATVAEEYPPTYIPGSHRLTSVGNVWAIPLFVRNWSTLGKIGFVGSLLNPSKVSAAIYSESASDGGVSYPAALLATSGTMYLEQTTFGPANYQNVYWWNFNLAVSSNSVIWVALCLPDFSLNNLIAVHPAGRMAPVLGLYGGNQASPYGPSTGSTSVLLSRAIGLRADLGFVTSGYDPSVVGWPSTFWPALNVGGTLYNFVAHLAGETEIATGYDWWPALMYDTHPGTGTPVGGDTGTGTGTITFTDLGTATGTSSAILPNISVTKGDMLYVWVPVLNANLGFPELTATFAGISMTLQARIPADADLSGTDQYSGGDFLYLFVLGIVTTQTGAVSVQAVPPAYASEIGLAATKITGLKNVLTDQFASLQTNVISGTVSIGPTGSTLFANEGAAAALMGSSESDTGWGSGYTGGQSVSITGGFTWTLKTAWKVLSVIGTQTATLTGVSVGHSGSMLQTFS